MLDTWARSRASIGSGRGVDGRGRDRFMSEWWFGFARGEEVITLVGFFSGGPSLHIHGACSLLGSCPAALIRAVLQLSPSFGPSWLTRSLAGLSRCYRFRNGTDGPNTDLVWGGVMLASREAGRQSQDSHSRKTHTHTHTEHNTTQYRDAVVRWRERRLGSFCFLILPILS